MKTTVFVDFNGIPGCGKSTICKKTIRKLEENKLTVRFLQDDIKRYSLKKIMMPFLILHETLQGGGGIVIKYIKLYNSLPKKTRQKEKVIFEALKNYMLARKITRECDADYVFSDQCIIQNLLSCFHDQKIENMSIIRDIIEQVLVDFEEFIRVDVNVDIEVSKSRIIERNAKGGRLDRIDKQCLLPILSIQKENLKKIRLCGSGMKSLAINSYNEADKNAEYIVESVLSNNQG